MMNKLILVDSIVIGNFEYVGYITSIGVDYRAYAIFVNNHEEPILLMKNQVDTTDVHISFNDELFAYIQTNKTKDIKIRKLYYKQFYHFIIESEKKASYMVFKGKKLSYIKNSEALSLYKKQYLAD